MNLHKALSLVLILCSANAWASPQFDRALKSSRFEDIEATTNYLLAVIEGASRTPPSMPLLNCDPTAEKAQIWMSGPMHALSDAKLAKELAAYRANPKGFRQRIKACAKTCTCHSFAALLDSADEKMKTNPANVENHHLVDPLVEKESDAKISACAKAFKSFCGSPIEAYLKSEN